MNDLISRQAAIDACLDGFCACVNDCVDEIEKLPSARKTGKWIEKGRSRRSIGIPESVCYTCSECGNSWWNVKGDWKFCPKCGALMMQGDTDD